MTRILLMTNISKINLIKLDNCITQLDSQMIKASQQQAQQTSTILLMIYPHTNRQA